MYQPPAFREDRPAVLHDFIRAHPLGLLISGGPDGLLANPVPFLLDPDPAPFGTLRAHLAKANAQWQALAAGRDVLVVFQGADAYVSPGWYASKREHGRVVPTWNYAIVQARGTARVVQDAAWLHAIVSRLTERHETGRAAPWAVTDAPDEFVAAQLRGIVGLEIPLTALEGKLKASQNRPEPDRQGVVAGLSAEAAAGAADMADLVRTGALDRS